MLTHPNIRRSALVVAIGPALIAGTSCSNDYSAETVTSVLESGDADTVMLPAVATVGQTAEGTIVFTMDISVSDGAQDVDVDVTMSIDLSTEVIDVADDGRHVRRSTVERLEVESSEASVAREVESSIPRGLSFDETYDAGGQFVSTEIVDNESLSASELAAAEEFVSQAETGNLYPPGAVVGVGSRWTATTTVKQQRCGDRHGRGQRAGVIDRFRVRRRPVDRR